MVKKQKESEMLKLNKVDMLKLAKGFGIGLGGFVLTFIADAVPGIDFGPYTGLAVVVSGLVVNLGRKLIAGK